MTDSVAGTLGRYWHPLDRLQDQASPEAIAEAAVGSGCRSVAFTYNDPVIFLEYAVDVAQACRERGIKTVAVSAGYICEEPRAEFFRHMDAANIDLKGFTEHFYKSLCSAQLGPVLDTLTYLKHQTNVLCGWLPRCKGFVRVWRVGRVQSCVRPHMMVSPSRASSGTVRGCSHLQGIPCQPHIRWDGDPNHCPACGTGELQGNGTTLYRRSQSAMPDNGDVPSDNRALQQCYPVFC